MPIYKPTELKELLTNLGITPKKSLSQNFLIDGNIIKKIVAHSKITPNDIILEIGPGPGALTEGLLKTGARIVAVEKDRELAKSLLKSFPVFDGSFRIYCTDIMDFSLESILPRDGSKKLKVIANLPYHLTTVILTRLISQHDLIDEVIVMVQDEVARRFVAGPGDEFYGSYSVFLRYHTTPTYCFQVKRTCFYPVPNVESAVVRLVLHEPPKVTREDGFFQLTRTAFQQRRKMISTSLKNLYDPAKVRLSLKELNLNPRARPEDLDLDSFIGLYEKIKHPDLAIPR